MRLKLGLGALAAAMLLSVPAAAQRVDAPASGGGGASGLREIRPSAPSPARPAAPSPAAPPASSGEYPSAQARPGFERPAAPSGGTPAPGGGGPAPAQSAPARPGFDYTPAPGGSRPRHDHGVVVGFGTYWWGWPYSYWDPYYPYYPYYPFYPFYPYYPYARSYPYYTYSAPAVVEPPVYVEQARPGYWYYCASAREYYPKAAKCPEPWIPVAPKPGAG